MNPTAIIEVTERCNLGCTFCLRSSFDSPIMDISTLEKVIFQILQHTDQRADFIWHGGEPLMAGLSFFEMIPPLQERFNKKGVEIRNNVQTNGFNLTSNFINFFKNNGFSVGTSIQGTQEIHDCTRITKRGKPTFSRIIRNISLLNEPPSGIVVLTTDIPGLEDRVYHELKNHVRGARVSEYYPGGKNVNEKESLVKIGKDRIESPMPTPAEYGESMIKFYNIWKEDGNPIDLKPITEIIRSFVKGYARGCLYSQESCSNSILGIKSTGDFYTCIRGFPDPKFFLGNVKENPLANFEERSRKLMKSRIEKLMEDSCGSCKFWDYCNGGCPMESERLYGNSDNKTYYCEGRKMLFEHILNDLRVK